MIMDAVVVARNDPRLEQRRYLIAHHIVDVAFVEGGLKEFPSDQILIPSTGIYDIAHLLPLICEHLLGKPCYLPMGPTN